MQGVLNNIKDVRMHELLIGSAHSSTCYGSTETQHSQHRASTWCAGPQCPRGSTEETHTFVQDHIKVLQGA